MALETQLWQAGNITTPGTMAVTTFIHDGSAGDKTTLVSVSTAPVPDPTLQITGMYDFDPRFTYEVSAFTVTYGSNLPTGGSNIASNSNVAAVEYFDGATWIQIGTNTNGSLGAAGTGAASFTTYTVTLGGIVTAKRIRAYVVGHIVMNVPGTPIGLLTGISDFRATYIAYADMTAQGLFDVFGGATEQEPAANGIIHVTGSGADDNGCVRLRETGCSDAGVILLAPATVSHTQVAPATTSKASVVACSTPRRKVRP